MMTQLITDFKIGRQDKFFIDTNVWVYLFYPSVSKISQRISEKYSELLAEILEKENLIFTNLIQFSELINVIHHQEYNDVKRKGEFRGSFKDFRDSEGFSEAMKTAKMLSGKITKQTNLQTGMFNSDEMKKMVSNCDKADFNDIYFIELAKKENLHIITHDFDFKAASSFTNSIITANQKYFQ